VNNVEEEKERKMRTR